MSSPLELGGAVYQNLFLAAGAREVHAVLTVDAFGGGPGSAANGPAPEAAEVLVLDCSGSMGYPPEKIVRAKQAAAAAIGELRDGVWFALVAGSGGARMLWPAQPRLVRADGRSRAAALDALRRVDPAGGTTIGAWLRFAGELLSEHPGAIRHAVLLTDGRNQHESPEELASAVRACTGVFGCDCRGVGTDWSVRELQTISDALGGTVELVAEPAGLVDAFRTLMAGSMRKTLAEVTMRLWTPAGATVRFAKQSAPVLRDLTAARVGSGAQRGDYPTGSWGTESREYFLCVELEPGEVGEEKLACRVTFVHAGVGDGGPPIPQSFRHGEPDGTVVEFPEARVRAIWTEDLAQSTVINEKVAQATGRTELADVVREGLDAHQAGDRDLVDEHFARARELAARTHDDAMLAMLDRIYDPGTGTFRLDRMSAAEEMSLEIESTKTTSLERR